MRNSAVLYGLSLLFHLFVGASLLPALALPIPVLVMAGLVLVVSTVLVPLPMALRLSDHGHGGATLLAWCGYLAMGWLSSMVVLTLLRDTILVLVGFASLIWPSIGLPSLAEDSAWAVIGVGTLLSLVGLFHARRVAPVREVTLPIAGLPEALHGFSIVQISDLHIGPTIQHGFVDAVVRRINQLEADLVALTGDIIDGDHALFRSHAEPLGRLQSRHGTYCVTGNHEYYHGPVHPWLDEWRRLGLRLLHNDGHLLDHDGARLLIAGTPDITAHHHEASHRSDPQRAYRADLDADLRVLLAHQPLAAPQGAAAGFDIQLSGHTHGGQFFPWPWFVTLQQPVVAGLHRVGDMLLYVSRGTGYWGPPLRLMAPSEITRLTLRPA